MRLLLNDRCEQNYEECGNPPAPIHGSGKCEGAASVRGVPRAFLASSGLPDDNLPGFSPDFGNTPVPDMAILVKHCIQQRLFQIVFVWLLLMWLPGIFLPLRLTPALWHGDDESDVISDSGRRMPSNLTRSLYAQYAAVAGRLCHRSR